MDNITVMSNAAGSWALLGRFPDSPETRTRLEACCSVLHHLSDRRTHFKLVDAAGKTVAALKDGASRFEPVNEGGRRDG